MELEQLIKKYNIPSPLDIENQDLHLSNGQTIQIGAEIAHCLSLNPPQNQSSVPYVLEASP